MNLDAPSASSGGGGGTSYQTPTASYGFNATPSSASGPPAASHKSLARFIADLQRNLRDAFEPALLHPDAKGLLERHQLAGKYEHDAALLHPLALSSVSLSTSTSTTPGVSTLQLPWELLTSALSSFEYQVLNAGVAPSQGLSELNQYIAPGPEVSDKDRIRLLALMRETGALTLADLATEEGVHLSKKILNRRKDYKHGFPRNFIGKKSVKEVLESIAKDAGWETFQGAEEDAAYAENDGMDMDGTTGTGGGSSAPTNHTITMAGKGVVLDVDFEVPPSTATKQSSLSKDTTAAVGDTFGTVTAVRFSYGLEGSTDPGVDKLLSKQAKAGDWQAMRESILSLARLDDIIGLQESMSRDEEAEAAGGTDDNTSSGELDPFSAMKGLSMKLEEVFKSELEVVSSAASLFTSGHGLATSYHSLPYTKLVYHVNPYVLNTEEWDKVVQSGFQNEEMAVLSNLEEGVLSITFKVQKSSTRTSSTIAFPLDPSTSSEDELKSTVSLLSTLPSGLKEKIATGLQFLAKLDKPLVISAAAGRRLQDIVLGSNTSTLFPGTQVHAYQTLVQPASEYPLQAETLEKLLLPDKEVGILYDVDMRDMNDSAPIQARLQPLSSLPAFKLEEISFEDVDQLLAIIEVLRTQACYDDMLQTMFEESSVAVKEQDAEASITLNSLLSDDPLPLTNVVVQTDTDTSWPPALSLTYLVPHLPSWLPISANVRITPSFKGTASAGYHVSVAFSCSVEIKDESKMDQGAGRVILETIFGSESEVSESEGKMQDVLALSGDPKLVMRWINGRVRKAASALKSLYVK